MNLQGNRRRLLALFLALALCFSVVPWSVPAAETETYSRISSMDELTTGSYVLVASSGYAPGVLDGTWVSAVMPAIDGDTVTDANGAVWTITLDGSGALLTDANGVSIAPKSGNTNGITSGTYSWAVACADGTFTFSGQGDDTTILASNAASENKFRAYKTTTVAGNPNGYPNAFTLYKLDGTGEEIPAETEPTDDTEPTEATDPTGETGPSEDPESADTGIADGDYVIWAPAYNKALSSRKTGHYNVGVDVTLENGVLSGYGNTEIWTVTNHEDGTVTISQNGSKLALADSYNNLDASGANDTWTLIPLGDGLYNARNVGRGNYLEWYSSYSNWSTYSSSYAATDTQFQLRFTPTKRVYSTDADVVANIAYWSGAYSEEAAAKLEALGDRYASGDKLDTAAVLTVVAKGTRVSPYYLPGSNGYMGGTGIGSAQGDYIQLAVKTTGWGAMTLAFRMRATKTAPGDFQLCWSDDGGATWNDFSTGSYACGDGSSTGAITDGVARTSLAPAEYISFSFDVPAAAENCDSLLIRLIPGDTLASGKTGTASASGTIRMDSVALSGSPILDAGVTTYVTVTPDGSQDQPVGTELTMTSEEGATIYYRVNGGKWLTYSESEKPTLDTLPCDIEAYAIVNDKTESALLLYHYDAGAVASVKMTPNGGGVYVTPGTQSEILLTCATEGAAIYYMVSADGETWPDTWTDYALSREGLALRSGFEKLWVRAYAAKAGYTDSTVTTRGFTERSTDTYTLYFGQLHSHTDISDGAGTVEEAFAYASNAEHIDFLAVTDHSNSFDNANSGVLSEDGSAVSQEWALGHEMAEKYTDDTFVGLYGFEMTWSNGLGHMNTYNTPGWQSRSQSAYTSYDTALNNYYETLTTVSESISMFNHPGTTFGDFSDFAHYSQEYDALITLIEVGNGEGDVGSSGYFPSYDYYTRALDLGWHVAPTNNQDNHGGKWGDANTCRTVVLTDSLTAESIYDAMRNYRVYATEDNDLNIYYTLNGSVMGSILDLESGDTLTLEVRLSDATDTVIGSVEVVVDGGQTAASAYVSGNSETVTFTLSNAYSYYYIRVVQEDGDIAVTAPVWTGETESCGISGFETDAVLPIQNEALNLTLDLYNDESSDLRIESIVFTLGDQVIHTADLTGLGTIRSGAAGSYTFAYTHTGLGRTEIYATVTASLNGTARVYREKLDLTFAAPEMVTRVVVDGTHYNDYVTGYYGGNLNNLVSIGAENLVQVNVVTTEITAETLADCDLLIVSAPARYSGAGDAGAYAARPFEDSFLALVADYVEAGGSVIVCGLADYQDKKAESTDLHIAAQLNKLLAAIGSTMRIHDDEAYDTTNNGGQSFSLYPDNFNMESLWCAGIAEGQTYKQYSGCTLDVGSGTWLVKGFDTTCSIDSDGDGLGGVSAGEAVLLAVESTSSGGYIFAAGGVFLSDFEISAETGSQWELPYANRTILDNIIDYVSVELPLSTIAEVRAAQDGEVFRIQGYVTAGTDNAWTTFFDAIYLQDETGGITVYPFDRGGVAIGTAIEIVGYVDSYQGDKEIQVMSCTLLDGEEQVYEPAQVSNADAMDYGANGGKLVQVRGQVVEVTASGENGVSRFVLQDENGDLATVFIDGYILSGTTGENDLADVVKVGSTVSAIGLVYAHPEGDSLTPVTVIRVRNCDEVVLYTAVLPGDVDENGQVDILDANLIVAFYNESIDLTPVQLAVADVDGNGNVDILDANLIVAFYNEMIDSFPAE